MTTTTTSTGTTPLPPPPVQVLPHVMIAVEDHAAAATAAPLSTSGGSGSTPPQAIARPPEPHPHPEQEIIPLVVFPVDFYVDHDAQVLQGCDDASWKKSSSLGSLAGDDRLHDHDADSLCTLSTRDTILLSSSCQILWWEDLEEGAAVQVVVEHAVVPDNHHDDTEDDEDAAASAPRRVHFPSPSDTPPSPSKSHLRSSSLLSQGWSDRAVAEEERRDEANVTDDEYICVGDLPRVY